MSWFSEPLKSDPVRRIQMSKVMLVGSLTGWIATHAMMLITNPPENSWVFHVLIAISWFAILYTAYDVLVTTDVRVTQDDDEGAE